MGGESWHAMPESLPFNIICIQLVVVCYRFPPVFENRKAIVVSPTVSLMLDQVTNLKEKGINAVYLGSAQLDHKDHALSPESDGLCYS